MDKWIKVNTPYSGIDTNGLVVQVGTYPPGAPELYGASQGIVDHGAGEWVDAPESEAVEEIQTVESAVETDAEKLAGYSNQDLRIMLDKAGVDHSKAKNKADLLALFGKAE